MTFISSNNSITIEELSSCNYDFKTVIPSLVIADTATIDLSGLGTTGSPLSAAAKLSTNVKNLLTTDSTGLLFNSDLLGGFMRGLKVSATDATPKSYIEDVFQAGTNVTINKITTINGEKLVINAAGSSLNLTSADSSTVDLNGIGVVGNPLIASVKISTTPGNALISNSTGLYVPTPSYTGESTLIATDSSTLSFSTSGTAGHSLTGAVKISNTAGNTLVVNGNGLYVPTPLFTQDALIAVDSNSLNFTTSGANGHTLTADIKISSDSGNGVEIRANGLFAASGVNTPITIGASDSIEILASGINSHTLTPSIKVSEVNGNQLVVYPDGVYVPTQTLLQDPITANNSNSIAFTVTGTNLHTLTGSVRVSADEGNSLEVRSNGVFVPTSSFSQASLVATDSSTIDFTTSGAAGHNLTGSVRISTDSGNGLEARANGLFAVQTSGVSGTTNYVAKFTSSSAIGNSLIFDDGTKVVIGGTSGSSLFNVVGQGSIINTTTYTSGTATGLGVAATTTFSGVLPSSGVSFSSQIGSFHSVFNGNTTVAGDTPFSSILAVSTTSFTSTGTVTMSTGSGGISTTSALNVATFNTGNINGTITKSAGIQINGIFQVAGSTSVITRTDHYQLLINGTNQFGATTITNRWGIYQVGSVDTNYFAGRMILDNLPVFADNTEAAILPTGTIYRTSTGDLKVKY